MLLQLLGLAKSPIMLLLYILFLIIPLLFSIVFHEMAHGWVAYKFGDNTAKLMGRLTLNPLKHLDPLGTIFLLVIGLGWAKPVIINLQNIPSRTKQMLVALAGPLSNILLALIFAIAISICENVFLLSSNSFLIIMLDAVVAINLGLALFNMIPVPPLDGSRILAWFLPSSVEKIYYKFEQYGIFLMLLIMFTIGFGWIFYIAFYCKSFLYSLLQVVL